MSNMIINPYAAATSAFFDLLFSGHYGGSSSDYFSTNPGGGSRTDFIFSCWVKFDVLSTSYCVASCHTANNDNDFFMLTMHSSGSFSLSGWSNIYITSTNTFNDGNWHHVVVSANTGNGTGADRLKLYVDGVDETTVTTTVGSSANLGWNQNATHYLGRLETGFPRTFDGHITQFVSLSGVSIQAGDYAVSDFYNSGAVDVGRNVTFGSSDFFISHQDRGDLGRDFSGNNKHFAQSGTIDWSRQRPAEHDAIYLAGDGADASTTFADGSLWRLNPSTVAGNAQIDTAQSKFGGASMLFDGTGDYLQWTHAEDAERTNLNNRESWTISLWIRAANINKTQYLVDRWKSSPRAGWFLYVTSGNIVTFFHNNTALSATTNIAADTWYHVAVTFDGTTCRLFLDGTQEASTGSLSDIDDNGNVINPAIAYYNHGGGSGWDGWIDDIWIRRGKAVWTSNFTSPTEARGDSTGHPEFITTIGIKNLELDSEDNNGYTVRNIIPISIVGEYDEIRATCKAALANALEVDNMSVGIHTSGGSTSATPTEILENATSGMSVAAGAKKTTDWTTFSFTDTDDLILIFDISSVASYFKLAISGSDSVYTKAATKSYDQSSVPSLILVPGQRYIADRVEAKTLAAA